jgi:RHS repeat-associated protein
MFCDYVYDGMGLVAKMTPSGNKYFYHFDGIGNTIAMTDSNGNMVNKYAYDEFGNLLNAVEGISDPFLYVGQYGVMDEDNGLLFMRARYYDPVVGRFISKDPIGYLGGINLYAYAGNNPIKNIDPLGLVEMDCKRTCGLLCKLTGTVSCYFICTYLTGGLVCNLICSGASWYGCEELCDWICTPPCVDGPFGGGGGGTGGDPRRGGGGW